MKPEVSTVQGLYPCADIRSLYDYKPVPELHQPQSEHDLYHHILSGHGTTVSAIIHLIWIGDEIPMFVQTNIVRWAEHNPDYEVWVWVGCNSISCDNLQSSFNFDNIKFRNIAHTLKQLRCDFSQNNVIRELCDWLELVTMLQPGNSPTGKNLSVFSDFFRLLFLYVYGGFYSDVNDLFFTSHKHSDDKTLIIKKLPPSKFFHLPLGFMMRQYVALENKSGSFNGPEPEKHKRWADSVDMLYKNFARNGQANNGFYTADENTRQNTDFLAATPKNEFILTMLTKLYKKRTTLSQVFKKTHPKTESRQGFINLIMKAAGPTFVFESLSEFLVHNKLNNNNRFYCYFPIKFTEFYFPKYMSQHGSWYRGTSLENPFDIYNKAVWVVKSKLMNI